MPVVAYDPAVPRQTYVVKQQSLYIRYHPSTERQGIFLIHAARTCYPETKAPESQQG